VSKKEDETIAQLRKAIGYRGLPSRGEEVAKTEEATPPLIESGDVPDGYVAVYVRADKMVRAFAMMPFQEHNAFKALCRGRGSSIQDVLAAYISACLDAGRVLEKDDLA
jgi:hypothetical protein